MANLRAIDIHPATVLPDAHAISMANLMNKRSAALPGATGHEAAALTSIPTKELTTLLQKWSDEEEDNQY